MTVDGWAVTIGTARRGLHGRCRAAHPGRSSIVVPSVTPHQSTASVPMTVIAVYRFVALRFYCAHYRVNNVRIGGSNDRHSTDCCRSLTAGAARHFAICLLAFRTHLSFHNIFIVRL